MTENKFKSKMRCKMSFREVFNELIEGMPMSMKIIGILMVLCFVFLGIFCTTSFELPDESDIHPPDVLLSDF